MFIYMKSYLFVLSILRKKRWSQSFKWHLLVVKKRFIGVRELVRKLLRIEAAEIVMKNVTITNRKILTLYNPYSMKKERILLPGCTSNSKFKGNIIIWKIVVSSWNEKRKKVAIKKCQFCGKPFAQKSNRVRHVNSQHASVGWCNYHSHIYFQFRISTWTF